MIYKRILNTLFTLSLITALFVLPESVHAQSPLRPHQVALTGGLFNYDLSGTGNSPSFGFSANWRIARNWLIENGVGFAFPFEQFDRRTKYMLLEAQVQREWSRRHASLFVGGGAGSGFDFRDGTISGTQIDFSLSAGGGVRADLTQAYGVRTEFRVHTLGSGSLAELRFGFFWKL